MGEYDWLKILDGKCHVLVISLLAPGTCGKQGSPIFLHRTLRLDSLDLSCLQILSANLSPAGYPNKSTINKKIESTLSFSFSLPPCYTKWPLQRREGANYVLKHNLINVPVVVYFSLI